MNTRYVLLLLIVILTPHFALADLSTGLVAYWDADGTSCTTNRISGGTNLTIHGSVNCSDTTTLLGNSFELLDSYTNYFDALNAANVPTGSSSRTMCGWAYLNSSTEDYQNLWGYGDIATGGRFGIRPELTTGNIVSYNFGADVSFGQTMSSATWTFICTAYDGSKVITWKNAVNGANSTKSLSTNNANVFFGISNTTQTLYTGRGYIDEIGIWSRILNQTEIENLYNAGSGCAYEGCITPSATPAIIQTTYNSTSAYANHTAWQNDPSYPITTLDTTPTITFDTYANAYCRIHTSDQNWTTMGDARNCSTTGGTSHTCTLGAADAYTPSATPQELYIGCIDNTFTLENVTSTSGALNISIAGASESDGRTAILSGLDTSEITGSYTSYTDRQVAIRLANGSQYQGTFDLFIESGTKRWGFNYDQITDTSFPPFENITPVFWAWEGYLLAPDDITDQISSFINSTN